MVSLGTSLSRKTVSALVRRIPIRAARRSTFIPSLSLFKNLRQTRLEAGAWEFGTYAQTDR
jgi:hypothetical protein